MSSDMFAVCARLQVAAGIRQLYASFGKWPSPQQLPVVYHDVYNISFLGIENWHVFDSKKFGKVVASLEKEKCFSRRQLVTPLEATEEILLDVHTPEYLHQIKTSKQKVAQVTELAMLLMLPNWVLQWRVVKPMRYMVAGTVLAAALAIERGWSINIGGGMHHACAEGGAGWCMFSDLSLALRKVRRASQGAINKIMIIDTDVHQGNGYEKDKLKSKDDQLYILDVYNADLWPNDTFAKTAINNAVELQCGTSTKEYLNSLQQALLQASSTFQPDLILYNAGTDILIGDPLGRMHVSLEGVVQRDELVFRHALSCKCPISMVLSGGYATQSAQAVALSIANLFREFKLRLPDQ